jgi:hypothetical protein
LISVEHALPGLNRYSPTSDTGVTSAAVPVRKHASKVLSSGGLMFRPHPPLSIADILANARVEGPDRSFAGRLRELHQRRAAALGYGCELRRPETWSIATLSKFGMCLDGALAA